MVYKFGVLGLIMVGLFWMSCSSKISSPAITESVSKKQEENVAANSKLNEGYNLFCRKCANCHRLYQPLEYTGIRWSEDILPRMTQKAKLNKEQSQLIKNYLLEFCIK